MKSTVFNNSITSASELTYPELTPTEEQKILAGIFEQLLIFDKITITTNRVNSTLIFLLKMLGVYTVERLLERGFIEFMLWSPFIATGAGKRLEDGTVDESVIYGQPPLAAGTFSKIDLDPERNIETALSHFNIRKDIKRGIIKKARQKYIVLDGMLFSQDSTKVVIDAYKENNLAELGLPYNKEPEQLNLAERQLLLQLSSKVLETAVLSKYALKSYENYEHYSICSQNLANIGKAYNVAGNTSEILRIENLPDLKKIYLQERLDFDSVFKIRYLSNAKYYRDWINKVGENANAREISEEYIKQIKGKYNFYQTNTGKALRSIGIFGISVALESTINGLSPATISGFPGGVGGLSTMANFSLGILDTFWLESILMGKNPSMFIDDIRNEIDITNAANI